MTSRSDEPAPEPASATGAAGPDLDLDLDLAVACGTGDVLERTEVIHPSPEDTLRFVEALLSPRAPSPAMVRAVEHHRRLFGGA